MNPILTRVRINTGNEDFINYIDEIRSLKIQNHDYFKDHFPLDIGTVFEYPGIGRLRINNIRTAYLNPTMDVPDIPAYNLDIIYDCEIIED